MAHVVKASPWDDCKVAFGSDADTDAVFAWAERFKRFFPKGWFFAEVDNSGARTVVVFRVEGRLDERDGEAVAKSLRALELSLEEKTQTKSKVKS